MLIMQRETPPDRPTLLMLSGCVPDRRGTGPQHRAWQLLQAARRTHRVRLAAITDEALNLAHWRTIAREVEALVMLPKRPGWHLRSLLAEAIEDWGESSRFDVVLCNSPVFGEARFIHAGLRVYDLGDIGAQDAALRPTESIDLSEALGEVLPSPLRRWCEHWWRSRSARHLDAAAAYDQVLVDGPLVDAGGDVNSSGPPALLTGRLVHRVPTDEPAALTALIGPTPAHAAPDAIRAA